MPNNDMRIIDFDGHVLEMNSSPMFVNFGRIANVPIGARFAAKLVELAKA